LLHGRGYADAVIAAAILHDVLEDTDAEKVDLERHFGGRVALLVAAISEPSTAGSYRERKRRLREAVEGADAEALAVYAADKVAKARELRIELSRTPGPPREERLEHYWASLRLLQRRLGSHPFVEQLQFELEALELLPPR
jgi:(p)ppGpp synthase/HD superfamily hydrolase